MEIWKSIKGYEGWYEVSDKGNVRSVDRLVNFEDGRYANYKGKSIKQFKNRNGYYNVRLWRNSKTSVRYTHRLVAEAFIPNPENKKQVNHKDWDKTNNHAENLEWVTVKENATHAHVNSLVPNSHKRKKVKQFDKKGNFIAEHESLYQAGKAVNGEGCKIGMVLKGKRKTHKGFIWKQ